jgi:Mg/Co/Ni transporter MgtE
MTQPVVTVKTTSELADVIATMEQHQIRRIPVVDDAGCCTGIIAQADIVMDGRDRQTADLLREISRNLGSSSR